MKRLFVAGVAVSLLVGVASISGAETKLNSSKSNVQKAASQGKGAKAGSAAQGQQDPCASVKNDPVQFQKCQAASHPSGLPKHHRVKSRY